MGPRARLIALSAHGVRTWLHFGLGIALLIGIAASVDFANGAGGSATGQALSSLAFSLRLVAGAAGAGIALWLVMRALRGKYAVHDFRDSVLWSAYVVAAIVILMRIVR